MGMPSSVSAPVVVEPGFGRCPANPWASVIIIRGRFMPKNWYGTV